MQSLKRLSKDACMKTGFVDGTWMGTRVVNRGKGMSCILKKPEKMWHRLEDVM